MRSGDLVFFPVVTSLEMQRIEKLAMKDGCSEEAFMLSAGQKIAARVLAFLEKRALPKRVAILVGKGNKGGDAFVAGICLLQKGIHVRALTLHPVKICSPLNQKFQAKFTKSLGIVNRIENIADLSFDDDALILDGLLGTGFQGKVDPQMSALIAFANGSGKPIIAIDIPSGLNGSTGEVRGCAIVANETVSLGCFKMGFFMREGWNHVGKIYLEDFGLPEKYLREASALAQIPDVKTLKLPPILRNRHKYQAGYVVGFSGSDVYRGAPKLSGLAAMRAGSGIVRVFHEGDIGPSPYSLICQRWDQKAWDQELKRASALFIGPGIGKNQKVLKNIHKLTLPIVFDADAIQKGILYPKQSILTPHRGEVLRLFGIAKDLSEEDLLARCQKWVNRNDCILVLKGGPTWIFSKENLPIIIPRGDPGMAKAGVGDALTGVIAALLAQKMNRLNAAILGVSLHACAGEAATRLKTSYGMIAEDLIHALPHAIFEHGNGVVRLVPFGEVDNSFFQRD
jgi:ADP-dependent NAD(P)H-hydrate dehydratase / NAD(P)H-hydrate epimerase